METIKLVVDKMKMYRRHLWVGDLRAIVLFYFLFFICSVNNSLVEEEKVNRNGSEFKEKED